MSRSVTAVIYMPTSSSGNKTYLCSSRLAISPRGCIFFLKGFPFLLFFGAQIPSHPSLFWRLFLFELTHRNIVSILNSLQILKLHLILSSWIIHILKNYCKPYVSGKHTTGCHSIPSFGKHITIIYYENVNMWLALQINAYKFLLR